MDNVSKKNISAAILNFQKSPDQIAQATQLTDWNEKAKLMLGRIEAHQISDVIKTTSESGLRKKLSSILSNAANSDFIMRNFDISGFVKEQLSNEGIIFEEAGVIINPEKKYLCCTPDGNNFNF